jgi:hypothetical protein
MQTYSFPGFSKVTTVSLADPPSRSSDPLDAQDLLAGGFKVKIRKGQKAMTLFRFLTAKLLYEENGLHLDEFLVLFELYFNLLGRTDPSFVQKYGTWFEKTKVFYQDVARGKVFPLRLQPGKDLENLIEFLGPVLPSKQAYYGLKGQKRIRQSFRLVLMNSLPPAYVRPKAYIGVGYRDKGCRRDTAYDGSPDWREVASHFSEIERRAEEDHCLINDIPFPPNI